MTPDQSYSLFHNFIRRYIQSGFRGIDREDPFILEMEKNMKKNKQFFFVADMIRVSVLFTSKRSREMIGVNPEDVNPSTLFKLTHPDDLYRKHLVRTRLFKSAQELFIRRSGAEYLSACFRVANSAGIYTDLLHQGYLFFSDIPHNSAFLILVLTELSHMKGKKTAFHYYIGPDESYFRYPDSDLIRSGRLFSDRELEIIRLIAEGLNSKKIAENLFLSVNTIATHRRNILKKTGKTNIHELIRELMDMGLL